MRNPSPREWFLLAAATAVILVSLFLDPGGKGPNAPLIEAKSATKAKQKSASVLGAGELDLTQLRRSADAPVPGNAFTSRSWYVPPPPPPPQPVVKVEPPPPTAPPLPFVYLGRYIESGIPTFFLAKGDRVMTAKVGEILDGNYRVEGVEGSTLNLTYLPLNAKQTLDIGSAG